MILRIKGLPPEDVRQLNKRFDEIEKSNKTSRVTVVNQGSSSPAEGDKHYVHNQISPSSEWTINHGLNKYPSVAVVDSAGTKCVGDIQYINQNTVTITFAAEFSGKAYLN